MYVMSQNKFNLTWTLILKYVLYRYLLRNNADVVSFKGILIMFASRCGETASLGSSKSSGTIEVERSMEEPPFDEDL